MFFTLDRFWQETFFQRTLELKLLIGNITKGNNFKGLLEYLLTKEQSYCLGSNIELEPNKSLIVAREQYLIHQYSSAFERVAAQRPSIPRPVYHVSLSLPKDREHLNDEQWVEIVQRYLKERGFENSQYVLVRHNDRDHEHCHIVTSRVTKQGQLVNDGWDYYKSQNVIREIEKDYGLQQIQNSWEKDRSQQSQQEIQLLKETQETSVRKTLQETIDTLSLENLNMSQLFARLQEQSVEIQLHEREQNWGISYKLNGISYPGYKLGRAYSFPGLQKHRGIAFYPETINTLTVLAEPTVQTATQSKTQPVNQSSQNVQANSEPTEKSEVQSSPEMSSPSDRTASTSSETISNTDAEKTKEIFHPELGKSIKQCLKLNQSWQKLAQLSSQYANAPSAELMEQIKQQTVLVEENTLATIALSAKVIDSKLTKAAESSIKLVKSWNELQSLNQQYFDESKTADLELIKDKFFTQVLQVQRDFRQLPAKTKTKNPTVDKIMTNSLELANYASRISLLGKEKEKNPCLKIDRAIFNEANLMLIELGNAYLDLPDDRITPQFKRGIKNYLCKIWGVSSSADLNTAQSQTIDLTAVTYNQLEPYEVPNQVKYSPQKQQKNLIRDYVAQIITQYGNRDPHNDRDRFENKNFIIEHSYSLRYGIGFEHKLEVLDRQNQNRKILEYRTMESTPNLTTGNWQLEYENLSAQNEEKLTKLGKKVEKLADIKQFRDHASLIVRELGSRQPGQLLSYGHYENQDYRIKSDRTALVVKEKNQNQNILVIAIVDGNYPELNAHANFTPQDLNAFKQIAAQIEQQKLLALLQLQQQRQFSRQKNDQLEL